MSTTPSRWLTRVARTAALLTALAQTSPAAAQDEYGDRRPSRRRTVAKASPPVQVDVAPLRRTELGPSLVPPPGGRVDPAPVPIGPGGASVALVGGTVHPVIGAVIEGGTVVIEDGRITAVGANLDVPAGIRRVDTRGLHVYPSLIDADTVLGLVEISAVRATNDIAEVGDINPNVRAEVSFHPGSELLPVTRSSGILVAMSAPRGGLITGTAAVMELDGWVATDMTVRAPAGLFVDWPSMRIDRRADAKPPVAEQEKNRDRRIQQLTEAFVTARGYDRGIVAEAAGGPAVERDVTWDAMLPVIRGEVPIIVRANDILEIRAALAFAESQNLAMILAGGADSWRVAEVLAERKIPVILTELMAVGRTWEPYDVNFATPAKLHAAGVEFCIAFGNDGFSAAHARNMADFAAKAVAFGLDPQVALEAVTLRPARILGVQGRLGSLEPGKDGTVIVTDGDPLDGRSTVAKAFIRGAEVDLSDRHKRLYERYRLRPRPATR